MSDSQKVATDDYVKAIQYAKDNGHAVNIDFSNLPEGVDPKAVATAAGANLPQTHQDALHGAAEGGHIAGIDYSLIGDTVKKAADMAMNGPIEGTVAAAKDPIGAWRSPIGQSALPIIGGEVGASLGMPGVGAAAGEAMTQAADKYITPDLAPKDPMDSLTKIGMQLAAPKVIESGVNAAKTAYPYFANMFTKVPMKFAQALLDNPELTSKFSGAAEDVKAAAAKIPQALKTLHEKAVKDYGEKLVELGVTDPKDAGQIADQLMEKHATASAKPLSEIGKDFLDYKTTPTMPDMDRLKILDKIDSDINSHLNYLKSGQTLGPVDSTVTPKLMVLKNAVAAEMKTLPGGQALKDLKDSYGEVARLHETLSPNLKDPGHAEKWVRNAIMDESGGSDTAIENLKKLDQLSGQPVFEHTQNQLMSSTLKKKLAPSMIGKMSALMTLLHPMRAYQLPIVGFAQSPALQTKAMQGLMALQGAAHAAPELISPMVAGLQQGAKQLNDLPPGDQNDLVANQGR